MSNVHHLAAANPRPRPILPEASSARDYPSMALGPLQAAVEAAQRATGAPLALAAQSTLSLASLAVQGFADVETLGGFRPVSLFALTIARSGERKSTVDRLLGGNVERFDRTSSEPTTDGLIRLLTEMPSAGLFTDEAGAFLGGYAMKSAQVQRTLATFNSAWDGKQIAVDRKKERIRLAQRRLTLHMMMQPSVADGLLAHPQAESIGFLPRCLIVQPESTIGKRPVVAALEVDPALTAFSSRLEMLMTLPLPVGDPELRELNTRRLPLSEDARALLVRIAGNFERAQAPGGIYEDMTAFASKSAEMACRIAAVLTLWRDLDATVVARREMLCGLGLAKYYLDEAARLMGRVAADRDYLLADELRLWLLSRPRKEFLMADVQQAGPKKTRSKPVAERMLSILESHGWVRSLPKGHVIDGHARKSAWAVCETC